MSFQKKLFKMNLKVAFIPMLALFILILVILGTYRHLFFSDLSDTDFNQDGTNQVIDLMLTTDFVSLTDPNFDFVSYQASYSTLGYHIAILYDNRFLLSDLSSHEEVNLSAYALKNYRNMIDAPMINTSNRYRYIVLHKTKDAHDLYLISVSSNRITELLLSDNLFFIVIIVLMILLLLFVFQLCRSYSKRLIHQLMLPIVLLNRGAKRIQEGNLDMHLDYNNNDEFQPVFDSFNEMQERLKDSILLSLERERKQQEMIAEISHDLKTPLTSIKGYVKGIEDGVANTPEKQVHYLSKIRKKTDDMTHLIDEILLFSRLERNKIKFETVPVEISSYLQEVLMAFQEDYASYSLQIHYTKNSSPAYVLLDSLQFNRVIENIIENSRKYSGVDHIMLDITASVKEQNVIITIKDNGKGISPDKLPYIFDTFYRADDARNQATNGSGLGLSITKHIIQQLSGTITAHNDNGLCFTITLPLIKENDHATNISN